MHDAIHIRPNIHLQYSEDLGARVFVLAFHSNPKGENLLQPRDSSLYQLHFSSHSIGNSSMANSPYKISLLFDSMCFCLSIRNSFWLVLVYVAVARSFLQVAATEEVASPLRVVQIEGLVLFLSLNLYFKLFGCQENDGKEWLKVLSLRVF